MKRKWLVVHGEPEQEIHEIDVIPGVEIDGQAVCYGHQFGMECDCLPQIQPTLDSIIVVHRADI